MNTEIAKRLLSLVSAEIVQKAKPSDPQMVFDFHKEDAEETTDNVSVKEEWKEAYETGYRIGERIGFKQGLEQAARGCPGVPKCDCEGKKCEE